MSQPSPTRSADQPPAPDAVPPEAEPPLGPDLSIGAGDPLGYLLVSDRPPEPRHVAVPAIRIAGLALGPLLSLLGLIYLALAVDLMRGPVGR